MNIFAKGFIGAFLAYIEKLNTTVKNGFIVPGGPGAVCPEIPDNPTGGGHLNVAVRDTSDVPVDKNNPVVFKKSIPNHDKPRAARSGILTAKVARYGVSYILSTVLVLSLFFGYGWGSPEAAYAAEKPAAGDDIQTAAEGSVQTAADEEPIHADPTGAYFIGPSFSSANASKDGTKSMKLTGNAAQVIEPTQDDSGYIRIVPDVSLGTNGGYGSAFLSRKIYSETGFSVMFDLWMGDIKANWRDYSAADGWSFIVAADTNGIVSGGGTLGYLNPGFERSVTFACQTTAQAPTVRYGEKGVRTGTAVALSTIDAAYVNKVKNIHCYSWVDYNSKEQYFNLYINSTPVKPATPVISRTDVDIESIIGNEYYIGFTAATGSGAQEYSLKQFYVLNNYLPDELTFSEDGSGLNPDTPLVEDFTPPTQPVVSQLNATDFTFGSSTDNYGVKKYQYRYSVNGVAPDVNTEGANYDWTNWTDYKAADTEDDFILDAMTPVEIRTPVGGVLQTEQSRVQARAVDTSGNISESTDYTYQGNPKPVAQLTAPVRALNSQKVHYSAAQSLTVSFTQPIDVSAPGAVIVTENGTGGDGEVTLAAITPNDTRWNGAHNQLTIPLDGVEYGASYSVGVSGFKSDSGQNQTSAAPFTFTVMGRMATPNVSIDYTNEKLVFNGGSSKPFRINGATYTAAAGGTLPLVGTSGGGSYSFIGQNLQIISEGDNVDMEDSAPRSLSVPTRPPAPTGLSGMASKLYGVTTAMQYTTDLPGSTTRNWIDCTENGTDAAGVFMNVEEGTLYVRNRATAAALASGEANVRVAANSVTLTLGAPAFERMGYGDDGEAKSVAMSAFGNMEAIVNMSDVKIIQGAAAPFELLINPGANLNTISGAENLELRVRPRNGVPVGEHNATVQVTYTFYGAGSASFTATSDISVVVAEKTPEPVIDYRNARITGLAGSSAYVIDGDNSSPLLANYNGYIDIDQSWFGRGVGTSALLDIRKYNMNTNLNSSAATLRIKNRVSPPQAVVYPETFTGFTDSRVEGVTAAMEFSSNNGSTWTDLATDNLGGRFDSSAGRITGLANGSNYRLRVKADPSANNFASLPQTITIASSATAPVYSLTLDRSADSAYVFQTKPYLYSAQDAAGMAHAVSVQNTGNQDLGAVTAQIVDDYGEDGDDASAFILSAQNIAGIATGQTDTGLSVRPAENLGAGTYRAILNVSAPYEGPAGSSVNAGTVTRSYPLEFTVAKAEITGFSVLPDWFPGHENSEPILTQLDTGAKVEAALKNGIQADGIAPFDGYPEITAYLDGGGRAAIPISSWTQIDPWNPRQSGSFSFMANLSSDGMGANIGNSGGHTPTVNVVLNNLDYGISLDRQGTSVFAAAEYGYRIGGSRGTPPINVGVRNLGVNNTGGLTATLSGEDAGSFALSNGSASGQSVSLDSISSQGAVNSSLSVSPVPGLEPGENGSKTYRATVTVSGGHGISQSFEVSFTVDLAQITGFNPIQVNGGRTGAPSVGYDNANEVVETLNDDYKTVMATYAGGAVEYPVTGWSGTGTSYRTDIAGVYNFTATPGETPQYFKFGGGSSPQLSVVIAQTVNAAQPSITDYPNGGSCYTRGADPGNPFILSVGATAADLGSGGVLSYQWYANTSMSNSNGEAIPDAINATYEVPRGSAGTYYYYCVVTNTNSSVNGVNSTTAKSPVVSVSVNKRPQISALTITDPGEKIAEINEYTFKLQTTGGNNGTGAVTFTKLSGSDNVAEVDDDGTVKVKSIGQIEVAATKSGDNNWLDGTRSRSIIITIAPKLYNLVIPDDKTAVYGATIGDVSLGHVDASGENLEDDNYSPSGTWAWDEESTTNVGAAGVRTHYATFTPEVSDGPYVSRTHVGIPVEVSPKPLTIDGITFFDKKYDGATTVAMNNAPALAGVIAGDNVVLLSTGVSWAFENASDPSAVEGAGAEGVSVNVVRSNDYTIAGSDAANYTLEQPAGAFSAKILAGFAVEGHYTTSLNDNGATAGDLVITANSGYQVSTGGAVDSDWSGTVTLATEKATAATSDTFYLRRAGAPVAGSNPIARGEISVGGKVTYTIDRTDPTAEVSYKNSVFKTFLNFITFGLFFKDTLDIKLKGDDADGSGVESLHYYIDRSPGEDELTADALSGLWTVYDDNSPPSVSDRVGIALYVKVTDKAGNSELYKDGIVIYDDSEAVTTRIDFTKLSGLDKTATVRLNNNTIKRVLLGGEPLTPVDNCEINGANITFKASYLQGFAASSEPYRFSVEYNPLGVAYGLSPDGRSEAPATTAIDLYVSKRVQTTPSVTVDGGAPAMTGGRTTDGTIETIHGVAPFTLIAGESESSGNYVWEVEPDSGAPVSVAEPGESPAGGGKRVVTVTGTGAATITVKRLYDEDYSESSTRTITIIVTDTTAPIPGGQAVGGPDNTLSHDGLTSDPNTYGDAQTWSTNLGWEKATDNITTNEKIKYYVYKVERDAASIGKQVLWEDSGDLINAGGNPDIESIPVTGLARDTLYSFNVVAEDEAGNKSVYQTLTFVTPINLTFTATEVGGSPGRAASDGILITFSDDVAGFITADSYESIVTVTDAAVRTGVQITDYGDEDDSTYYAPVDAIRDRGTANVSIGGWTQGQGEHLHDYRVFAEQVGVTVWAPVPEGLPSPVIDYRNETLTNLSPGAWYRIGLNPGDLGSYIRREAIGGAVGIDPAWMNGKNIWIIKEGSEPTPPEESGTVDSAPNGDVAIPERLAAPERYSEDKAPSGFTVAQPAYEGDKGELGNVSDEMQYRYYDDTGATWGSWQDMGVGTTLTNKSGLDPGEYELRMKYTDSNFASGAVPFFIHTYGRIGFPALVEDYSGEDVTPVEVSVEDNGTIENISLVEGVGDFDDFTVASPGALGDGQWTVEPNVGLGADHANGDVKAKQYTARIRITVAGEQDPSYQDVLITVHPRAQFTEGPDPAPVTTDEADGTTDTLTLNFKYPTDLTWSDVTVTGATNKDQEASGFTDVSPDKKSYKLKVLTNNSATPGAVINVSVALGGVYVKQAETEAQISASAGVKIARSIASANVETIIGGYNSSYIQFTLGSGAGQRPILWQDISEDHLDDPDRYSGKVKIEAANDSGAKVTVAAVYPVTNAPDYGDNGAYTYRVFFFVETGGAVEVSIPEYGVDKPFNAGTVKDGTPFDGMHHFLMLNDPGQTSKNRLTDMDGYQIMNPAENRGESVYLANSYPELYTSMEYTGDNDVTIYLDKDLDGLLEEGEILSEDLYESGHLGQTRDWTMDGASQPQIADQLIITLNQGWTMKNGTYKIAAIVDGRVAQGRIVVSGITETSKLTVLNGSSIGMSGILFNEESYYKPGSSVQINAGSPSEGLAFDRWEKALGGDDAGLPPGATGNIIMPADDMTVRAVYKDGVAPVTAITPPSGGWSSGSFTLSATDVDKTRGDGDDAGVVEHTYYSFDYGATWTEYFGFPVRLPDEGPNFVQFRSVDEAGNIEMPPKQANIKRDTSAPTATISFNGAAPALFDGSPSVVHFYKGLMSFRINPNDSGTPGVTKSDIAETKYLVSKTPFATTAAALSSEDWEDYTTPFELGEESEYGAGVFYVYAQIRDYAGNITVVNTQGVVMYKDSEQDDASISFTKLSHTPKAAHVTLNGNSVAGVTRNTQDNPVPLVRGTDYTLNGSGDTITFTASYLQGLPAGASSHYVSYNPQGKAYSPQVAGNRQPGTTSLTVNVQKAQPGVSLTANPQSGAKYGQNMRLSVDVDDGAVATGSVEFFDGDVSLGTVELSEGGSATIRVALGAGEHDDINAMYSGDGNYLRWPASLETYSVAKAAQETPQITGGAEDITAVYGDENFNVRATGGKEDVLYVWESSNPNVAAVGENNGLVVIKGRGHATLTVKIAENANYDESATEHINITVNRKPVVITGVTADDKVYDGTVSATPVMTGAKIDGMVAGDSVDDVTIVPGNADFASAGAGTDKDVTFKGFGLTGAKAANYVAAEPQGVKATIWQRTPEWAALSPSASDIMFGQRVSASEPSGLATGVDDVVIEGRVEWSQPVNTSAIPANSDNDLNPQGYAYPVTFIPDDTTNYTMLDGAANIHVNRALPYGAKGTELAGSPIFVSGGALSEEGDTLDDVTVTSDVYYSDGGVGRKLSGTWAWVNPGNTKYTSVGSRTETATFTPSDTRVAPRDFNVTFDVVEMRPVVDTAPTAASAEYGSRVGDVTIITGGAIVNIVGLDGNPEPITGSWEWKEQNALVTSMKEKNMGEGAVQEAALLFTPDDPAYVSVETSVDIPVTKVDVQGVTVEGTPLYITYGAMLTAAAIGASGYSFGGVIDSDDDIPGTLEWVDDLIIPTAEENGAAYPAIFEPTGDWANVYNTYSLGVPVNVMADDVSIQRLETDLVSGEADTWVSPSAVQIIDIVDSDGVRDNYDATAIADLKNAVDDIRRALDSGSITQHDANELIAGVGRALDMLEHDHPIIGEESNLNTITEKGRSAKAAFKGVFHGNSGDSYVFGLRVGDKDAHFTPIAEGVLSTSFTIDGRPAGTITKGSAIVALDSDYLDTLTDGNYRIVLNFHDGYSEGFGETTLTISRKYKLTVVGGSGSGNYAAGAPVPIAADVAPAGKVFDRWTNSGGGSFASLTGASTNFTMPANAAVVTATYKDAPKLPDPEPDPLPGPTPGDEPNPTPDPTPGPAPSGVKVSSVKVSAAISSFSYKASGNGNTLPLGAAVEPAEATDKTLLWTSNNTAIATVDAGGIATFRGPEGDVTFTATAADGSGNSSEITIKAVKNVTGMRTPLAKVNIQKGKNMNLPVVLDDSTAPTATIASKLTWKSSNPLALSVAGGKIKAARTVNKKTTAKVTATAANGRSITFTVTIAPKAVKLKSVTAKLPAGMKAGGAYQIKVKLNKATATGVNVSFSSSPASVISVDKAGKLFALKKGKATVTVKAGNKKIRKKITVK
jgi:hypothetical protein